MPLYWGACSELELVPAVSSQAQVGRIGEPIDTREVTTHLLTVSQSTKELKENKK